MSDRPDRPWGWTAPARIWLIVLIACAGLSLAWDSDRHPSPALALPTLEADANAAPDAVLLALPGLGPVLTGRIVEARPFRSMDDLDRRVKGIGPAKVAGLKPYLRFDSSADHQP